MHLVYSSTKLRTGSCLINVTYSCCRPAMIFMHGDMGWDQLQLMISKSTTVDLLKMYYKLDEFFSQQFKSSKRVFSSLGTPRNRTNSGSSNSFRKRQHARKKHISSGDKSQGNLLLYEMSLMMLLKFRAYNFYSSWMFIEDLKCFNHLKMYEKTAILLNCNYFLKQGISTIMSIQLKLTIIS